MLLDASYVQRVVHALNDRFLNLLVFIAAKLFNPRNYPSDDSDQITNTRIMAQKDIVEVSVHWRRK
jgi:hypothetical protein